MIFFTKNNSKVQYHTYICEKCNMKNTSIDIYASHGRGFEPEELGIISCDEYIIKKILE